MCVSPIQTIFIMQKTLITMQGAIDRLGTIKASSRKKIEIYAKRCYQVTMSNDTIKWWNDEKSDKDVARAITRPFYDLIHSCSIPTGLITENAFMGRMNDPKYICTKDHIFRPQFVCRYILDNHKMFKDFAVFREWVIMCCSTTLVTKEENADLRISGTNNRGEDYVLLSSTDNQYNKIDLKLFSHSNHRSWRDRTIQESSNLISPPQKFLDYEVPFLDNL